MLPIGNAVAHTTVDGRPKCNYYAIIVLYCTHQLPTRPAYVRHRRRAGHHEPNAKPTNKRPLRHCYIRPTVQSTAPLLTGLNPSSTFFWRGTFNQLRGAQAVAF